MSVIWHGSLVHHKLRQENCSSEGIPRTDLPLAVLFFIEKAQELVVPLRGKMRNFTSKAEFLQADAAVVDDGVALKRTIATSRSKEPSRGRHESDGCGPIG